MTTNQADAPILISCLHSNTPLCLALGKHLEAKHERHVHFISDDCPSSPLLPKDSLILTAESRHPKAGKNNLFDDAQGLFDFIYKRDRFLKNHIDHDKAMALFEHWSLLIINYLELHHIRIVIIEGTPAYELLLEFWARKVGARIVCPAQIVWGTEPSGVLYSDSIWSSAYILNNLVAKRNNSPAFDVEDKIFDCNDSQAGLWKRFTNFIANRSLNSPTRRAQIIELIRRKITSIFLPLHFDDHQISKITHDLVSYFLHIDPEKSVDNSGCNIWPQTAVIKDLRERLHPATVLVVREHPQINGKRVLRDVRFIQSLPNTFYVSGQCDRMVLINKSRFVCTISGSVAGESAAKGASVVVYGRPIFLYHPRVVHIESVTDIHNYGRKDFSFDADNGTFSDYIEPRLGKFVFGDIYLMATALSKQNITNLANAILDAENFGWMA